jgi:hypothetical protein
MLKGGKQSEDAINRFIDAVFNTDEFWKRVKKHMSIQPASAFTTTKDDENVFVVVVFDEARGLLDDDNPKNSLFLAIRRSLADAYEKVSLKCHMFGVFMDTSSKTANFSP